MAKARNLSTLLAADGQVEDAKIDGLTSSKLTGALPAIDGSSLTNVVAVSGVATDATKLPLAGGAMTGAITTNSTFDTRDVAADGTKLDTIASNANLYVHPNHSGDVVSAADGATTIQADAVDIPMLSASGTADATTFLRGDNQWSTPTNTTYTAGAGIVLTGTAFSAGPIALTTVQVVANQTAQLALTAEEGDVAVRSDEKKSYMHNGGSAGSMADWTELQTPTDSVLSVNGQTGAITAAQLKTAVIPSQSGNSGKFLTTDATNASWATVDALPTQSGNAGKYLTTDATNASWAVLDTDANTTTKGLYEHAHTIASNYSITSGNNALTAGPITINTGVSVTVPTGSTWIIA